MLDTVLSTLLQIIFFSLIPFIAWLIRGRKQSGFLNYIGLKRSNTKANLYGIMVSLLIGGPFLILVLVTDDFYEVMTDPESVTGSLRLMGVNAESVITLILLAVFKTSFSEEIFFRGFVAKRLIGLTNFKVGNIIQAILFGIIHTLLFLSITNNILYLMLIFLFPATGAFLKVYINEKLANGSIIPGWIAHGTGNILAYSSVLLL